MKKHTKIVATISDQRCDIPFLTKLYNAGMDVVRINTAHQDIEGSVKLMQNIRQVSDKIAVIIDTKGPEIRTTVARDPIHVEKGEELLTTIKRECKEETGITDLKFIDGFRKEIEYFFRRGKELIKKKVIFLLAETKTRKVTLSYEHVDYAWLPYKEALERVTFKNAKEVLRKANRFLEKER